MRVEVGVCSRPHHDAVCFVAAVGWRGGVERAWRAVSPGVGRWVSGDRHVCLRKRAELRRSGLQSPAAQQVPVVK